MMKKYGRRFEPTRFTLPSEGFVEDKSELPDWWKAIESKADKARVINKISVLWYGSTSPNDRNMARYHVVRSFTPEQFFTVLRSRDDGSDDAMLRTCVQPPVKRRTRKIIEQCSSEIDCPNEAESIEADETWHGDPQWYIDIPKDDKAYVLTRMQYMWYHNIDNLNHRRSTRGRIIRNFTEADFYTVLNQNTDYVTLNEIAERTGQFAEEKQKEDLKAMKNRIYSRGAISQRALDRRVEEAIKKKGFGTRPISELEEYIIAGIEAFHQADRELYGS